MCDTLNSGETLRGNPELQNKNLPSETIVGEDNYEERI